MRKTVFALLLLVTGIGLGAYSWWHSPSTSSGADRTVSEVRNVLGTETALKPLQTKYFSTSIPASLKSKTSTETQTYANYLLTSSTVRISDQIGISVAALGNNSLDELPAVKLRLSQPTTYLPVQASYLPDGAYAFTDEAGYETSVFWKHDGMYAAVVSSGTSARRAELDQALQVIVSSWNWR